MKTRPKFWTKEEYKAIIRLLRKGLSYPEVASTLGATQDQVKNAVRMIRKVKPEAIPAMQLSSKALKALINEAINEL